MTSQQSRAVAVGSVETGFEGDDTGHAAGEYAREIAAEVAVETGTSRNGRR